MWLGSIVSPGAVLDVGLADDSAVMGVVTAGLAGGVMVVGWGALVVAPVARLSDVYTTGGGGGALAAILASSNSASVFMSCLGGKSSGEITFL